MSREKGPGSDAGLGSEAWELVSVSFQFRRPGLDSNETWIIELDTVHNLEGGTS